MMAVILAACGQKTSSGVKYESASKGDLQKSCRQMLIAYAEAIPIKERQRAEKKQIKPCCKKVAKEAGGMNGMQRAYAAYDFLVARGSTLTPNQRDAALETRDAIGGDLTGSERAPAVRLRYTGLTCMSSNARKAR